MSIIPPTYRKALAGESVRGRRPARGQRLSPARADYRGEVDPCVATVVFSLFVVAYGDRMTLSDWRPLPEPWLLWLNTGILMVSSAAMQWATVSARQGRMEGVKAGLLAGGGFAFAFLIGQFWVWRQLAAAGYYADTNPAAAFFYLAHRGARGAPWLGGLVAWGRTV